MDNNKPPHDPVDRLAWWLDEAFTVPGTKFRVGLDPILGLIPGLGDTVTTFVQAWIVLMAATRPPYLPKIVVARMAMNVFLDSALGAIPLIGNIFDFFFRASTRNRRLIQRLREEQQRGGAVATAPHIAYVAFIALIFLALLGGLIYLAVVGLTWFVDWLRQSPW